MMHKTKLKVVGLDPSMSNCGVAIGYASLDTGHMTIPEMYVVSPDKQKDNNKLRQSEKDLAAAKELYSGISKHIHDADIVCIEVPYGSKSARAMMNVGMCTGVLGSLNQDANFIFVTPQMSKKLVGGVVTVTKREMIAWASAQHPEAPWPRHRGEITITKAEHMADAIVAIYAASQTKQFKTLIQEYKHANQNSITC